MANAWFSEMDALPFDPQGNIPPASYRMLSPELVSQQLTFTPGTAAPSATAFGLNTKLISFMHDHTAPVTVKIALDPVADPAVVGSHAVKNGEVVYIKVRPGWKISVR